MTKSANRSHVLPDGGQFLTFQLRDEECGLEILCVQEIKGYSKVTPLPNPPPRPRGRA